MSVRAHARLVVESEEGTHLDNLLVLLTAGGAVRGGVAAECGREEQAYGSENSQIRLRHAVRNL